MQLLWAVCVIGDLTGLRWGLCAVRRFYSCRQAFLPKWTALLAARRVLTALMAKIELVFYQPIHVFADTAVAEHAFGESSVPAMVK